MAENIEVGPLDALVKSSPVYVAEFIASTGIIRRALDNVDDGSYLLLPERGSLPMFWAADGADIEPSLDVEGVRLPIGSFYLADQDTKENPRGTLRTEQKKNIIADLLDPTADRFVVIDEVQAGGTSSELMGIVTSLRPPKQSKRHLLLAAQDNRERVAARRKAAPYMKIVSGNNKANEAMVVPMPLIATDRLVLLNRLHHNGTSKVPLESSPEITTVENKEAIAIFRYLGSAARTLDILHSSDGFDVVFDRSITNRTAKRIEIWSERFKSELRARNPHTRRLF